MSAHDASRQARAERIARIRAWQEGVVQPDETIVFLLNALDDAERLADIVHELLDAIIAYDTRRAEAGLGGCVGMLVKLHHLGAAYPTKHWKADALRIWRALDALAAAAALSPSGGEAKG